MGNIPVTALFCRIYVFIPSFIRPNRATCTRRLMTHDIFASRLNAQPPLQELLWVLFNYAMRRSPLTNLVQLRIYGEKTLQFFSFLSLQYERSEESVK